MTFTDVFVMLPGLRGDRLATEVRRRFPRPRLPIILMSASADPRLNLCDMLFVPKPFDSVDLLDCIGGGMLPLSATR